MAKPATCSVLFSSVRRTCRNFASNGDIEAGWTKPRCCIRFASCLLNGGDPFQGGDSFFDRRVGVEEGVEKGSGGAGRGVHAHPNPRMGELRRRPFVLRHLLQNAPQTPLTAPAL